MLVWDNQQTSRLGWFTGILEGEGSFQQFKKYSQLSISNTDEDIIDECKDILEENHIMYIISSHKRNNRKKEYNLLVKDYILNYPDMLYRIIYPHLECRLDEYQKILGVPETGHGPSIDLDWLIGIWEAEGSFSIVLNNKDIAAFKIDAANTNNKILSKIMVNLNALECPYYVESKNKKEVHHRQARSINIYGMKRCRKFLYATKDKWKSYRNQKRSSLMIEFIDSRLVMDRKEPYTDQQLQIIQSMKHFNR